MSFTAVPSPSLLVLKCYIQNTRQQLVRDLFYRAVNMSPLFCAQKGAAEIVLC